VIDPEVRHIIEPELQDGEELLWAGRRLIDRSYKERFRKLLNWLLWLVLIAGICLVLFGAYKTHNYMLGGLCLFLLALSLWVTAMVIVDGEDKSIDLVYAITDHRLISKNSIDEIQTVTGKPFYSLVLKNNGAYKNIYLYGPGNEDDSLTFDFNSIQNAEAARKLIEARFMQLTEKSP